MSSSEGQISRSAFLYILLVLGALVCTGLFTRRLTRTPPGREARHG
jgi:ABC-type branched-subunit amino acid transport system permease subunit